MSRARQHTTQPSCFHGFFLSQLDATGWQQLSSFGLTGNQRSSNSSLANLRHCRALRNISFGGLGIDLPTLELLNPLPHLEDLHVYGSPNLPEAWEKGFYGLQRQRLRDHCANLPPAAVP